MIEVILVKALVTAIINLFCSLSLSLSISSTGAPDWVYNVAIGWLVISVVAFPVILVASIWSM